MCLAKSVYPTVEGGQQVIRRACVSAEFRARPSGVVPTDRGQPLVLGAKTSSIGGDRQIPGYGRGLRAATQDGPSLLRRCPGRKPHPCRSSGMFVLMEGTPQSIAPPYVEAGDLPWIGGRGSPVDRRGTPWIDTPGRFSEGLRLLSGPPGPDASSGRSGGLSAAIHSEYTSDV